MRQALGPGALGRPRGIGWRGRWEGRSGWGTHVTHGCFISMYDKIHYNKKKKEKKLKFKYKKKKKKNPASLISPALAGGFFTTSTTWEAHKTVVIFNKNMYEIHGCMFIYTTHIYYFLNRE